MEASKIIKMTGYVLMYTTLIYAKQCLGWCYVVWKDGNGIVSPMFLLYWPSISFKLGSFDIAVNIDNYRLLLKRHADLFINNFLKVGFINTWLFVEVVHRHNREGIVACNCHQDIPTFPFEKFVNI